MTALQTALEVLCLVPVVGGSVYGFLCALAVPIFLRRPAAPAPAEWPAVSILKPIHGLEKDQERNLRSACTQDYPRYQVILSAQRLDEPALPLMQALAQEFGPERVTVTVANSPPVVNGKVQNLEIALQAAKHDVLVISDSDVHLRPDYLKTIVAPLADARVGYACTFYRAVRAQRWYEQLELLSLNAEFTANLIFATVTGASNFCLGSSVAFRRRELEAIGGFAAVADYLNEDYQIGQRIQALGLRPAYVAYFVDTMADLASFGQWWRHQRYWDKNTSLSRPFGFFATVLTRAIPFALLFALLRMFDTTGIAVLIGAIVIRLVTSAFVLRTALNDGEGLRALWLLPLRDVLGLGSWFLAFARREFVWRGNRFTLTGDGRIAPRQPA